MEALRGGIRLGMIKGIRGGWLGLADGWPACSGQGRAGGRGELRVTSYEERVSKGKSEAGGRRLFVTPGGDLIPGQNQKLFHHRALGVHRDTNLLSLSDLCVLGGKYFYKWVGGTCRLGQFPVGP